MLNKNLLHTEMLRSVDKSIKGEQFIRNYYKFPLGLFMLNDPQAANEIYNHIMSQIPDKKSREFDTYYDCWLHLYTTFSHNPNSKLHYEVILKNKISTAGFSALPAGDPELRATSISVICASFEKDIETVKEATDFIIRLYKLNRGQDNFYFMTDKQSNLIKDFFVERERTHVFKTQKARPMLYSFSLAVIALLSAHTLTGNFQYLKLASKYAQQIMQNDFRNDYCGKSLVAMSMMYEATNQKEYLQMADALTQYINQLAIYDDTYKHNGQLVPVDRLSEYAIGFEFYDSSKERTSLIKNYLQVDTANTANPRKR